MLSVIKTIAWEFYLHQRPVRLCLLVGLSSGLYKHYWADVLNWLGLGGGMDSTECIILVFS